MLGTWRTTRWSRSHPSLRLQKIVLNANDRKKDKKRAAATTS